MNFKFAGVYICEKRAEIAKDGHNMAITIPITFKAGYYCHVTTDAIELHECKINSSERLCEVFIPAGMVGRNQNWFTVRRENDTVFIEPRKLNTSCGRYDGERDLIIQGGNIARIQLPDEYARYSVCHQYFDPETKAIVLVPRPQKLPTGTLAGWKVKSVLDLTYQGTATIKREKEAPYAYIHYSVDMMPVIGDPTVYKYGRYITTKQHVVSLFPHAYENNWEEPAPSSTTRDTNDETSKLEFIKTGRLVSWKHNDVFSYVIRLPEQFIGMYLAKHVSEKGIITLAKGESVVNEVGKWFLESVVQSSETHKGVLDLGRPCSRYLDLIGKKSEYYNIYHGKGDKIILIPN